MRTLATAILISTLTLCASMFVLFHEPAQTVHAAPISSIQFQVQPFTGPTVQVSWPVPAVTDKIQTFWLYVDWFTKNGRFDRVGLAITAYNNGSGILQGIPCSVFLPSAGLTGVTFTLQIGPGGTTVDLVSDATTQAHAAACAVEGTVTDGP